MIKKEDELWKGMMESAFPDFMRFVHPGVDRLLDLSRGYEFLDKELKQVFLPKNEVFAGKEVDKLVKVYTQTGQEQWVLIHVEVQAKYSKDFGRRMFEYYYRLFDQYKRPITAYAIFTESNSKIRSNVFTSSFMGTTLNYQFNACKIAAQSQQELLDSDNPFAMVVRAAKIAIAGKHIKDLNKRDQFTLKSKISLVKELLSSNFEKEKVRSILNFIIFYIRFELSESRIIFEKEVYSLTKYRHTMGIEEQIREWFREEGKIEGKKEEQKRLAHKLISTLGYTDSQAAKLLGVPRKFITGIRISQNEDKISTFA